MTIATVSDRMGNFTRCHLTERRLWRSNDKFILRTKLSVTNEIRGPAVIWNKSSLCMKANSSVTKVHLTPRLYRDHCRDYLFVVSHQERVEVVCVCVCVCGVQYVCVLCGVWCAGVSACEFHRQIRTKGSTSLTSSEDTKFLKAFPQTNCTHNLSGQHRYQHINTP